MANNKKAQNFKEVEKAGNQSSVAINGTDMGLDMLYMMICGYYMNILAKSEYLMFIW